jgi:1-deoxy-D-xylulose-5-phosphate reductoisomerase
MKPKILILGSTGKLGTKLIRYCYKNNIDIFAITCFKNYKKLNKFKLKYDINNTFILSNNNEKLSFIKFLKSKKIDLVYFLDYGSGSLEYADYFLKNNSKSIIAIANKEMIIAGGNLLKSKILKTRNKLIPLDSEHFSMLNSKLINKDINKLYITASGGPFYFKKNIDLNRVIFEKVVNHPKWKMGINNSIDSSNFINKLLEIYETSILYEIDLNKIDFLISKDAFIHSIVHYNDNTISINCFDNDMIIPLIKPLSYFYEIKSLLLKKKYLNPKIMTLETFSDIRFEINKYFKILKKLDHQLQIKLMILNNIAHKYYVSKKIKYNEIYDFIISKLFIDKKDINLKSFNEINIYIKDIYDKYEIN